MRITLQITVAWTTVVLCFSRRLTKLPEAICFARESSFLVNCPTCDQTADRRPPGKKYAGA